MNDDVRKLLGGYATGTLTPEERSSLYRAALEDPQLFAALSDEQTLRDVLDQPEARAQLLDAISGRRFTLAGAIRDWLESTKAKALVATAAVLAVAIGISQFGSNPAEIARAPQRVALELPSSPAKLPEASAPAQRTETKAKATRRTIGAPAGSAAPPVLPAPAASPPPGAEVAADSLARLPTDSGVPVRYEVLRREPSGAYVPVAPDFLFESGDRARLRFDTQVRGMLLVTRNQITLFAGVVSPQVPVLVPAELTFEAAPPPAIDVAFTPLPAAATGVVAQEPSAGVIGGVPPAEPAETLFRPRLQTAQPVPEKPAVNLKIQLKKK